MIYSTFVDNKNNKLILPADTVELTKTLDGLVCTFIDGDERVLFFKDYGKTWANTKEELLN